MTENNLILEKLRRLGESLLGGMLIAALLIVPPLVALSKDEPVPKAAAVAHHALCEQPDQPVPEFCK